MPKKPLVTTNKITEQKQNLQQQITKTSSHWTEEKQH